MWKQKTLKKKVRTALKQNYWTVVSVCFLIALLTSAYPASTTFVGSHAVNPDSTLLIAGPFSPDSSNSGAISETFWNVSLMNPELEESGDNGPALSRVL